jgi:hypothetical protein
MFYDKSFKRNIEPLDKIAIHSMDLGRGCVVSIMFPRASPVAKYGVLLLININSYSLEEIAQGVDEISRFFLQPRNISYFQFKRVYENSSFIILANNALFFNDLLETDFAELSPYIRILTHQSSLYFWDECLSEDRLSFLREKMGIYHGISLIGRRKKFYDCASFAMSEQHPLPCTYYASIFKELQTFAEIFEEKAKSLIKKATRMPLRTLVYTAISHKSFFLPKRSSRFTIGKNFDHYITTYEALCMKLFQDGKSYKEIGSILSMSPSTVKTHLNRLRARTGLSLKEISLESLENQARSQSIAKNLPKKIIG